jgi:hypothetical protein
MPYKWKESNRGILLLEQGRNASKIEPGEEIPEGWLTDSRKKRLLDLGTIVEFERIREVKRPKAPKGDKK